MCASSILKKDLVWRTKLLDKIPQQCNDCFSSPHTNGSSWKILIVDVHHAQQTDKVKCILMKKTDLINVPHVCTSRVQPLDVVFNKPYKVTIRGLFEQHIDENLVNWIEEKLAASQRRVFITKCVGTAWSEMSKKEDMISRSLEKCGITLALDGSENADLNTEGLKDCKMPSAEEAYEFQLQGKSSSCGEEQEDILFYFILFYQFSGFKDKMFWC